MRRHKGNDPWGRGSYDIPQYAVAGSSDTGTFSDSPAPTPVVETELEGCRAVLRAAGIRSRLRYTRSGNCCMLKRWVVVGKTDFDKAREIAERYVREHDQDTRFIHDARE